MSYFSRIAALTVSAGMVLSALPVSAFAEEADNQNIYGYKNTFNYFSSGEKTADYVYSNEFFKDSGKISNEHLRTMSLALSLALYGTDTENASELFRNIGFSVDDLKLEEADVTSEDTIGTAISHKDITFLDDSETKVVAVAIRGDHYFDEWKNNFDCGTEGDIKGIAEAAAKVVDRIKAYEEEFGQKGAKIWIAGYSRGGAVADLVGKYINEHPDEFGISADDLYDYTFEALRASSTDNNYENIHNVINPNDVVPIVYPEEWGIYNAGVDEYIECDDVMVQPMDLGIPSFKPIPIEVYDDEGEYVGLKDPVPAKEFNASFVNYLTDNLTRENFAVYGIHIGNLVSDYVKADDEKQAAIVEYFKTTFKSLDISELLPLLIPLVSAAEGTPEYDQAIDMIAAALIVKLDATDHSACLTDDEYADVMAALPHLLKMAASLTLDDIDRSFEMIGTFAGNIKNLISNHFPETQVTLLQAADSYYAPDATIKKGDVYDFSSPALDPEECTDEKLKEMGFDDNDIDYRNRGYDLWLGYDNSLESIDAFKAAYGSSTEFIDKYYEENYPDRDFEYGAMLGISLAAVKNVGYEDPVRIDVTNTLAAFTVNFSGSDDFPYSDDIEYIADNVDFKCLYFEMGDKSCTPVDVTASVYDEESIRLDISYLGEGVYVFYYEYDKIPDPGTDEPTPEPDPTPVEPIPTPVPTPEPDPMPVEPIPTPVPTPVPSTIESAGSVYGGHSSKGMSNYYQWSKNLNGGAPAPTTDSSSAAPAQVSAATAAAAASGTAASDTTNPSTGAAGAAIAIMTLAAAVVVVSKKRK